MSNGQQENPTETTATTKVTEEKEAVGEAKVAVNGVDLDVPESLSIEDQLDLLLVKIRSGLTESPDEEETLMPELETSATELESPDSSLPDVEKFRHRVEAAKMAETKQNKQHVKKDKKRRETASSIEALSVALKTMPIEQQVATLLNKYAELVDDNKKLQDAVRNIQKQAQLVQKEKENMESEHQKIILTKGRLESLCRELQKQNKNIKDENMIRLKEEEERRKEVSAKFNSTLTEISGLMKENSDKNVQLRDENQSMAVRLQELIKQYEERESYVDKMLKQKELQCQLAEAKLAKQQIEMTEDKEKMLLEKKSLLEEISSYQQKTQTMSMTEITLRTQLNSYVEKYEEFTSALDKSNKVFNTFKEEIDMMTKKIKKLEKETKSWKDRWEGANKALLEMVNERSELESKIETQTKQNAKLQSLCRALQEQVTEYRKREKVSPGKESVPNEPQDSEASDILQTSADTATSASSVEAVKDGEVEHKEVVEKQKEVVEESSIGNFDDVD